MGQLGKKILFLVLGFFFFSCNQDEKKINKNYFITNQFIENVGNYSNPKFKVMVKEFVDETLAIVIADKRNKNLYQSDISMSFNKGMSWFIYYEKENIFWIYVSDYNLLQRIEYDDLSKKMIAKNYDINSQYLPKILRKKILK